MSARAPEALLDPGSHEWGGAAPRAVALVPTPVESQPSVYVQVAWAGRARGDIGEVTVRARAGVEGGIALHLEWETPLAVRRIDDWNVYADACAVLFPADDAGLTPIDTMGSPEHPVHGWSWRAGTGTPFAFTARGLGTVERAAEHPVEVAARWAQGRWTVVFTAPGVPPAWERPDPHAPVPVGFAVWSGAMEERAGLKSYSPAWQSVSFPPPGDGS